MYLASTATAAPSESEAEVASPPVGEGELSSSPYSAVIEAMALLKVGSSLTAAETEDSMRLLSEGAAV